MKKLLILLFAVFATITVISIASQTAQAQGQSGEVLTGNIVSIEVSQGGVTHAIVNVNGHNYKVLVSEVRIPRAAMVRVGDMISFRLLRANGSGAAGGDRMGGHDGVVIRTALRMT